MRHLVISAIGRDRPGIVEAIAERLVEHQVNIEDSRMSILRGHFSMSLIVAAPDDLAPEVLREDLERAGHRISLEAVTVNAVEEVEAGPRPVPSHVVTVYGADHPGIVHAISSALAGVEANITDLQTQLSDQEGADPLYVMLLEVAVPAEASTEALEESLRAAAGSQGVDLSFRPLEQDRL
jgi:glycine cleavage system transcriptional repressor